LDLAPLQNQSPLHVCSVHCLFKPASCAFLLALLNRGDTFSMESN
jgi:hypothetical protein